MQKSYLCSTTWSLFPFIIQLHNLIKHTLQWRCKICSTATYIPSNRLFTGADWKLELRRWKVLRKSYSRKHSVLITEKRRVTNKFVISPQERSQRQQHRCNNLQCSPCISCHPPRTDPPQTLCPHRSPCCSFWRCWGSWWLCALRRGRCPCQVSTKWQFSWWRRLHLWSPKEDAKWTRNRSS